MRLTSIRFIFEQHESLDNDQVSNLAVSPLAARDSHLSPAAMPAIVHRQQIPKDFSVLPARSGQVGVCANRRGVRWCRWVSGMLLVLLALLTRNWCRRRRPITLRAEDTEWVSGMCPRLVCVRVGVWLFGVRCFASVGRVGVWHATFTINEQPF